MASPATSTSRTSPPPVRPGRTFGAPPPRPSSAQSIGSASSSQSPTPTASTTYLPIKPHTNRTRSGSSVSSMSAMSGEREGIFGAADKGMTWLSGWAPKGEGRSREFFANTLSGVANVASTVGTGVHGAVSDLGVRLGNEGFREGRLSRPLSFTAIGTNPSDAMVPPADGQGLGLGSSPNASALSVGSPPGPLHSSSSPAVPTVNPTQRRILQPANMSRLGSANAGTAEVTSTPTTTISVPPPANRPSMPASSSTSALLSAPRASVSGPSSGTNGLGPHGHSHLNPNAPPASRSVSHSHVRAPSFSNAYASSSRSRSMSRSSSTTAAGFTRSAGMPYKIGFQPAGVRSDKTGDYNEARRAWGEEREKEEGRLGRRWAKLVELHFNPSTQMPNLPRSDSASSVDTKASLPRSTSARRSLISMDGALDALRPNSMWKGIKSAAAAPGSAEENRKRAEEQLIVKWEDDKEAKRCRICQAAFNLSNRKHHCRLCGRLVCSLPPTNPALLAVQVQLFAPADPSSPTSPTSPTSSRPQSALPTGTRREKCSLLLVADWKTGRGEEVEEGFVGWMKLDEDEEDGKREKRSSRPGSIAGSTGSGGKDVSIGLPLPQQPKEVQVKGIRTCRECWAVVSRKQKMQDRQQVTGFARLYAALRSLQAEIEEVMVDFEGQMDILASASVPTDPPPALLKLHKNILTLFGEYEHLSKRVSSIPAIEGGSQSIVQSAVARSAALFMAKEMAKVQALPRLQKMLAAEKRKSMRIVETTFAEQLRMEDDAEAEKREKRLQDELALSLQPLLEQEAQLELYIADANAQRKYDDGKSLSEALGEIRAEIARVTEGAFR